MTENMTTRRNQLVKRLPVYWTRESDEMPMVTITGPHGDRCTACAVTYDTAIERFGLSHHWHKSSDGAGNSYWQQDKSYLHHFLDTVLHGELPANQERYFGNGNPNCLEDANLKRRDRGANRHVVEARAKKDAEREAQDQYDAEFARATGAKRLRGLKAAKKLDKALRDRDARGEL